MNTVERIGWHIRMGLSEMHLRWTQFIHCKSDAELIAEYDVLAGSITQKEADEIECSVKQSCEQHEAERPELDPRRTMLIHSKPDEHACNAVTVPLYRQKLIKAITWAQERGINVFLVDYCTPLGLLALETLVEMRDAGAGLRVYAVKSCYMSRRRTYRMVPETEIELIFLLDRADYYYQGLPEEIMIHVFPSAWTRCTERGIWYARSKVPEHLIEAWK